jgi:hypothetical protein
VCRIVVTSGSRAEVCAKPANIVAELGRAKRREALEARMAKATEDLASAGPARVANSDAKAIAVYMTGLGWEVSEDRVNKWLVLLAVLLVECGGGIALTIGQALSAASVTAGARQGGRAADTAADQIGEPAAPVAAPVAPVGQYGQHPVNPTGQTVPTPATAAGQSGQADILAALAQAGGRVEGLRRLADHIGRPRTTVSAECHAMARAGSVSLTRGRHGYVVALARPN